MADYIIEFEDDVEEQNNFVDDDSDEYELSFHHKTPRVLQDLDWNDVTDLIQRMDLEPGLNEHDRLLAQLQKHTILTKRRQMAREKLVMRPSYKGYSFHTYPAHEFEQKSSEYMKQKSDMYTFVKDIKPTNPKVSQKCLADIVEQVETTLKDLLCSKLITGQQYVLMHPNRLSVQMNYLYFVPNTHKEGIPVEPIVICKDGPTMDISRYLSHMLWSIMNQVTGCTTFANGADAVLALELYTKNGHLQPSTLFATFNVNQFCTMFPHDVTIKALEHFLNDVHGSEQHTNGLTNETIVQLVRLVLQNQFFVYQNKLYRQTMGGSSGSLLTIPLACIYMFYCQPGLMTALANNKNEIFGRCRDDMFLTWNGSKDQFRSFFDISTNDEQHARIQITPSIGTRVHFLNVELRHDNGVLRTKVYHDPATDEYALPNKFEYQTRTRTPPKLLQAALMYAVRCSSIEADFHDEIRHITHCHMLSGFSAEFVKKCMMPFFLQFDVAEVHNEAVIVPYGNLRQRVLEYHQQQVTLKKQRQAERTNVRRIPYPKSWNAELVTNVKSTYVNILKECLDYDPSMKEDDIEMVPRPDTPLTMNDYLVDKKPPHRLLTLSESEKNKKHYN